MARVETRTGGRSATAAIIPGRAALAVGRPDLPAPDGWRWRLLTDLARLESGHTPSRKHPEYWGGATPWIGIRDATGNHGRVLHETTETTNELGIANSSARVLPAGTVCLSRTASVGFVVVMGRPMATSQDFVNWVCSDRLNNHFLKYVLLSEQAALRMFAVGSVHPTIYFPEVKAFHICMPPRDEQDRIVEILGTLDEKMDLNRRMNETLEAMARAIFKDWFVDFGPTRAKMEGLLPYLAPDLWALFPDRLDDEGKPEGWRVTVVSKVTSELRRGMSPAYTEDPTGVRVLNQKCIRNRAVTFGPARRHDPNKRSVAGREILPGDILVNSTGVGTLGRTAQIWDVEEATVVDSHITVVRAACDQVSNGYLGLNLTGREAEIEALGEGSTGQTELSRARLGELPILAPPLEVQSRFEATVYPILQRITANRREDMSLAATRDLLLPRLVSGEIRVREAEKMIAAIA